MFLSANNDLCCCSVRLRGPFGVFWAHVGGTWSSAFGALRYRVERTMIDLYTYPLWVIFAVAVLVVVLATELGFWIHSRAGGGESHGSTSMLAGAILGLLALMIGFTFSMTLSRFEARREAVLAEANAIGTTALRARLLPEPQRSESLRLLRDYVKVRLDLANHVASNRELASAIARSNALQESLWQQAMAVASLDKGVVPTATYVQSLNEMIDSQGKRLSAVRNRMPSEVLVTLFAIAAVASAFAAYASGDNRRGRRLPVYVMAILVAAVILVLLDLDRPDAGFIKVSQQPMIDAAESIAGFAR